MSLQCYGTRLCPSSPAQACFTVWSNASSSFADQPGDHVHNSGLDVKMMGCFQASPECTKNDNCTADSESDRKSARGHLFCCCSGQSSVGNPKELSGSHAVALRPIGVLKIALTVWLGDRTSFLAENVLNEQHEVFH